MNKVILTPTQQKVFDAYLYKQLVVVSAGRRWGKTTLLEYIVRDGVARGWNVGYLLANVQLRSAAEHRLLNDRRFCFSYNAWGKLVCDTTGATVSFDTTEDRGFDLLVMDEYAIRYSFVLNPMRSNRVVIASTPSGPNLGEFREAFRYADRTDSAFVFSTLDNPNIPRNELKELYSMYNFDGFMTEVMGRVE